MTHILNTVIAFVLMALAFPHPGSSQDDTTQELRFSVDRINRPLSIAKETLNNAQTLTDLNRHYLSSWVREYISVEISAFNQGRIKKATSKNDTLSREQKDIMHMADVGTDISVYVHYIPENTLKHNDAKEFNFSFMVNPETEATFSGGEQQLKKYIKEHAIDRIPSDRFNDEALAAIKFTIDEEGHIFNVHVFETSRDEQIDELLLETICNMPNWKPAEYSNGVKVKQEFALTVGNMESCVINLLNIRELD